MNMTTNNKMTKAELWAETQKLLKQAGLNLRGEKTTDKFIKQLAFERTMKTTAMRNK